MIPTDIHAEIMRRLAAVEQTEGVRILLAIESGSRAWGFASPNSDFDVRFIYVRPKDWYLAVDLESRRDVIEYPIVDDIDLNGWDVRKALMLFSSSNPAFVEWVQSPIQYMSNGVFSAASKELLPMVYSFEKGIYHYRSMAKTNFRGYLMADMVPLKKYFYVLRPLLAVRWIETYHTAPPIEFDALLHLIGGQDQVLEDIHALLARKKQSLEKEVAPQIKSLNAFIEAELSSLESLVPEKSERHGAMDKLNQLFHAILEEPALPRAD
ncbi:nucleotidyltransferase domain-containing protein [Janthinobacterium fluminis]|uniref:Nucleotidyltransferase domain-containing protein n=1 Tax=Janthinobacterium fluminis TaxID=2987524 RepID=A0ABT5K7Q9_9BURK|nr:nucleotidyltransferase domain-containing protein [Janthinobacterium fluminis]MDC8760949.1 nucleotidyltransferase domain-containing protein [Janthinobacterium fluminis]